MHPRSTPPRRPRDHRGHRRRCRHTANATLSTLTWLNATTRGRRVHFPARSARLHDGLHDALGDVDDGLAETKAAPVERAARDALAAILDLEQVGHARVVGILEPPPGAATLDAVAAAPRVSKGGLLYHFASNTALPQTLAATVRAGRKRTCPAGSRQDPGRPSPAASRPSNSTTTRCPVSLTQASDSRTTRAGSKIARRWVGSPVSIVPSCARKATYATDATTAVLVPGVTLSGGGRRGGSGQLVTVIQRFVLSA